ncbi:AAA domain-containing protein [Paenibacillus sp. S3N08]|uniref:AAA domain-containing protein n=2 Tax=Paenibacillus agricola TaxID=2716264 RepID=A0ABX0JF83_9BACL|nr:AAA domain-containing protein [Paenibacillus agricola]
MQKLVQIRAYLTSKFVERESVVEALLIALISRQHLLLISPAGTAKSALSAELAKIVDGASYFQWLLTRFSTPEELFGPISLKGLEQDVYRRNTTGKLPESHISFIDEIFKANSAILNALLTIINERLFYNDNQIVKCPLMSVVGSSNEYPEEGEGLEALFDRFLLRYEIGYIADEPNFISMMRGTGYQVTAPSMTLTELEHLQDTADLVDVPDSLLFALSAIRTELRDAGITPSDRRYKQSLSLLQAKALIDQRTEAKLSDLMILSNALWETVGQKAKVKEVVEKFAMDRIMKALQDIEQSILDINNTPLPTSAVAMEQLEKLKRLEQELTNLQNDLSKTPDHQVDLDRITGLNKQAKSNVGSKLLEY